MKNVIFILFAVLLLVSCSEEQTSHERTETPKAVEVVYLNNTPTTRGADSSKDLTNKVLKFRDEASFEKIKNQLKLMDETQRKEWFKNIGFEGAYTELAKADNELDSIFDIEDDSKFIESVSRFKDKYSNEFVFNDSDSYDLSPYLPFTDDDLELVGNIKGIVMVGNLIKQPTSNTPQYYNFLDSENNQNTCASVKAIQPAYEGFNESSLMIKQGKYQSTVQLGVDRNSGLLMIRFASQKKKKLWKRRHECDYTVTVNIGNHQWNNLYQPNEKKGLIKKHLLPYLNVNLFNGVTNCSFKNFHSGACPNANGNKNFTLNLRGKGYQN